MTIDMLSNLGDLANWLDTMDNTPRAELGFDMRWTWDYRDSTAHPCGTACCISGWVQKLNPSTRFMRPRVALRTLDSGMSLNDVHEIVYPAAPFSGKSPYKATPKQAAFLLRHYIAHREVRWDLAMAEAV